MRDQKWNEIAPWNAGYRRGHQDKRITKDYWLLERETAVDEADDHEKGSQRGKQAQQAESKPDDNGPGIIAEVERSRNCSHVNFHSTAAVL